MKSNNGTFSIEKWNPRMGLSRFRHEIPEWDFRDWEMKSPNGPSSSKKRNPRIWLFRLRIEIPEWDFFDLEGEMDDAKVSLEPKWPGARTCAVCPKRFWNNLILQISLCARRGDSIVCVRGKRFCYICAHVPIDRRSHFGSKRRPAVAQQSSHQRRGSVTPVHPSAMAGQKRAPANAKGYGSMPEWKFHDYFNN